MTTIVSDRLVLQTGDSPLSIQSLTDRATGATICAGGEQIFFLRLPNRLSDPIFLREVTDFRQREGEIQFTLTDSTGQHQLTCAIAATARGLRYRVEVTTSEPLWMVEWKIAGLDLHEVIVPALGGQVITRNMPVDEQISYKYPFWWNAQFAVGVTQPGEAGIWLRTMDEEPVFKILRVQKVEEDESLFILGLGIEAKAPLESNQLSVEWYLDGYEGGWEVPVDLHRRWLEETFHLVPYHAHPHFPAWAEEINMILEIWGMRRDLGRPGHTFDQMIERIEEFAQMHPPQQTLLYLPGFAANGIDSHAPDYTPSELLGGRAAFGRLVERAHELGYRVMIHTNVLALTYTHPLFAQFAAHQVVDPFGRRQSWGLDIDGDWTTEPYFAYVNPGEPAWGEVMASIIGELVETFKLDAVFLDQTLLAFNVSQGPNFVRGMRSHVEFLQSKMPHVLFPGEGLHEQVLSALPMAQIHGLDSIARVHGIEGKSSWRQVHPVSAYLFRKYTKLTAHLLTKHPSVPMFGRQQSAYEMLGIVPALVLYRRSHTLNEPGVERLLDWAKKLSAPTPAVEWDSAQK
jgi:hypothetical protein